MDINKIDFDDPMPLKNDKIPYIETFRNIYSFINDKVSPMVGLDPLEQRCIINYKSHFSCNSIFIILESRNCSR